MAYHRDQWCNYPKKKIHQRKATKHCCRENQPNKERESDYELVLWTIVRWTQGWCSIITNDNYVNFLCATGYGPRVIQVVMQNPVNCTAKKPAILSWCFFFKKALGGILRAFPSSLVRKAHVWNFPSGKTE